MVQLLLLSNEPMTGVVDSFAEKWRKRRLTSFKFLSLLNVLSGRTFRDVDRYPVFPFVGENNRIGDCSDRSMPSVQGTFIFDQDKIPEEDMSRRLFVLPELYFFAEALGSVQRVYDNRKRLEKCENLEQWIAVVFGGYEFKHRRLFDGEPAPRHDFKPRVCNISEGNLNLESTIVYCGTFKGRHDRLDFGCVLRNGAIAQVKILVDTPRPTFEVAVSSQKFDNVENWHFGSASLRRVIVAWDSSTVIVATSTVWVKSPNTYLKSPHFSERICQTGRTTLQRWFFDTKSIVLMPFAMIPAKIVCFVTSPRFNVTAVGCADGKLRLRSNRNGMKIATLSLDNQIPSSVLITKSWGFVVVRTELSFFVFNINGMFITKSSNSGRIRNWTTFRTHDGFDFVAYEEGDGRVWYFEAIDPSRLTCLEKIPTDIAIMRYDWRSERLIIITHNGLVKFVVLQPHLIC
jgi:hypothetical protein